MLTILCRHHFFKSKVLPNRRESTEVSNPQAALEAASNKTDASPCDGAASQDPDGLAQLAMEAARTAEKLKSSGKTISKAEEPQARP